VGDPPGLVQATTRTNGMRIKARDFTSTSVRRPTTLSNLQGDTEVNFGHHGALVNVADRAPTFSPSRPKTHRRYLAYRAYAAAVVVGWNLLCWLSQPPVLYFGLPFLSLATFAPRKPAAPSAVRHVRTPSRPPSPRARPVG
jgi:hypothetical protein